MLRTPRKVLCGLAAAACCLSAAISSADPILIASQGAVGLALPAQTGSPAADAVARTNDLLRRARTAMAENNLEVAETLISQAESLGVKFSPLTVGDTPAKARRDLERLSASRDGSSGQGGNLLSGLGLAPGQPSKANPFPLPAQAHSGKNHPLLEARRALARGDVRHARKMLFEASSGADVPAPIQDGPEKVAKDIREYEALLEQRGRAEGTQGYRREFAKLMLAQAEALLDWGDLNEAERLTNQAADQRVMFHQFERTPERMLQRITQARRPAAKPAPGELQRLPETAADPAAKQKVERLLRQARAALAGGSVRDAELYAKEAAACGIPESAFGAHEDSPGRVLGAIARSDPYGGVVQASLVTPATGAPSPSTASQAYYDRSMDRTRDVPAAYQEGDQSNP